MTSCKGEEGERNRDGCVPDGDVLVAVKTWSCAVWEEVQTKSSSKRGKREARNTSVVREFCHVLKAMGRLLASKCKLDGRWLVKEGR